MKKIFIFAGWCHIEKVVIKTVVKSFFPRHKVQCWFLDKDSYLKSRFSYADATGKKIEAIFIGPIPHKSFAAKGQTSMIAEVCIAKSKTPVYVCRNMAGELKFTKSSVQSALKQHVKKLHEEALQIEDFKSFLREIFPNQNFC